MKKSLMAIMLVTAAGATTLSAQIARGTRIAAKVPFSFYKGDVRLPAGEYEFRSLGPNSLMMANYAAGKPELLIVVPGRTLASRSRGRVTFHCYQAGTNRCYLRSIGAPGAVVEMVFPVSAPEKELRASGAVMSQAVIEPGKGGAISAAAE